MRLRLGNAVTALLESARDAGVAVPDVAVAVVVDDWLATATAGAARVMLASNVGQRRRWNAIRVLGHGTTTTTTTTVKRSAGASPQAGKARAGEPDTPSDIIQAARWNVAEDTAGAAALAMVRVGLCRLPRRAVLVRAL